MVKIESITAEIFLIWTNDAWTNVAWTNVAWTNVTVTVVICSIWSQQCLGTIGSVTAEIVGTLSFCGGWGGGMVVGFAKQFSCQTQLRLNCR